MLLICRRSPPYFRATRRNARFGVLALPLANKACASPTSLPSFIGGRPLGVGRRSARAARLNVARSAGSAVRANASRRAATAPGDADTAGGPSFTGLPMACPRRGAASFSSRCTLFVGLSAFELPAMKSRGSRVPASEGGDRSSLCLLETQRRPPLPTSPGGELPPHDGSTSPASLVPSWRTNRPEAG
jgi:hypothetical protein